jgi:hypothetical protein
MGTRITDFLSEPFQRKLPINVFLQIYDINLALILSEYFHILHKSKSKKAKKHIYLL